MDSKYGTAILLQGVSSSGKTTISKELIRSQRLKFVHLSLDEFVHGCVKFINGLFPDLEPSDQERDVDALPVLMEPMFMLYFSTNKLLALTGHHVVADTVIDRQEMMEKFIETLSGIPVVFVKVKCSKDELMRREKQRGDRRIGLALEQFDSVYAFGHYDFEVDTETLSPVEAAEKILNFIDER